MAEAQKPVNDSFPDIDLVHSLDVTLAVAGDVAGIGDVLSDGWVVGGISAETNKAFSI